MSDLVVHIGLKVKGSPKNIDNFYKAGYEIDTDWPFAGIKGAASTTKEVVCTKCGGKMYRNPRMSASDIKRLGPQFGVSVKVKQYAPAGKCADKDGVTHYKGVDADKATIRFHHGTGNSDRTGVVGL